MNKMWIVKYFQTRSTIINLELIHKKLSSGKFQIPKFYDYHKDQIKMAMKLVKDIIKIEKSVINS